MTIYRDLSTPERRAFWSGVDESAAEVATWPAERRAGINVADIRATPREVPPDSPPPIRTTLREIERAAFVATRALDEGDREAARVAIEMIRERVGRLPA